MLVKSNINRQILRIAIPAIVSNITTPLLGLVDTAITGHLGAAVYLAAIAVGATMFSMIYWVMNFLRMGSSGVTAQAYGAGNIDATAVVLRRALTIALVASTAMIALSPWLADAILAVMDADAATARLARTYFMIVIWGAPAVLGTYALSGWFLGMQDSRAPMWMALVTNVVNIAASLILVFVLHMRIEGVALGTIIAQWVGLSLGFCLLRRYRVRWRAKACSEVSWRRFFSLNTDIFLRTLCLAAVTMWFTRSGAAMGTDILAANSLLMQLFILFSYFMDGFAFAGEALSGRFLGESNHAMLSRTIKGVFLWSIAVVVLFTTVYMLGGRLIVSILTDDFGVIEHAQAYLPWAIAVPVAGVAAFVWDGVFIGMTLTRQMLLSMLAATIVFFAGCHWLTPLLGNHGLWLAFIAYLLTRGVAQTLIFKFSVTK